MLIVRTLDEVRCYNPDEEETMGRLPLRAAYPFGETHSLEKEIADIRDTKIKWDRLENATRAARPHSRAV
jgi:hypothetical protein